MRFRRRPQEQDVSSSHGIDLAPMLDFCINLLIFFIITAVFIHTSGVIVNRQTSVQQNNEKKSHIIQVQIRDNGKIWMGHRVIDVRAVRSNIERLHAIHPEAGVLIIAQQSAPMGVLVKIADQARLSGIYNISFATTRS